MFVSLLFNIITDIFMYIIEAGQADVPLSRDFMESELGVKTVSKTRKV